MQGLVIEEPGHVEADVRSSHNGSMAQAQVVIKRTDDTATASKFHEENLRPCTRVTAVLMASKQHDVWDPIWFGSACLTATWLAQCQFRPPTVAMQAGERAGTPVALPAALALARANSLLFAISCVLVFPAFANNNSCHLSHKFSFHNRRFVRFLAAPHGSPDNLSFFLDALPSRASPFLPSFFLPQARRRLFQRPQDSQLAPWSL